MPSICIVKTARGARSNLPCRLGFTNGDSAAADFTNASNFLGENVRELAAPHHIHRFAGRALAWSSPFSVHLIGARRPLRADGEVHAPLERGEYGSPASPAQHSRPRWSPCLTFNRLLRHWTRSEAAGRFGNVAMCARTWWLLTASPAFANGLVTGGIGSGPGPVRAPQSSHGVAVSLLTI